MILLVRGDSLEKHMSDYLVREIRTRPNVEVRLRTEAVGDHGDGLLERLTIADRERGLRRDAIVPTAQKTIIPCFAGSAPFQYGNPVRQPSVSASVRKARCCSSVSRYGVRPVAWSIA